MQNPPLDSSNNPDSSTLGKRLQRRLVEPAGVINTQQLHCHYQATQGTPGRLIQRLAVPEQVKFRYGSGVLQPTATIQRLQRQRRESADVLNGEFQSNPYAYSPRGETIQRFIQPQSKQFDNSRAIAGSNPHKLGSSHTNPLQQNVTQEAKVITKGLVPTTDQNHLKTPNPISLVSKKPKSNISTPLVETSKGAGEGKKKLEKHRKLRIDLQGTVSEVNALSSNESHVVQRQVDTDSDTYSNSHPTVTPAQLETSRTASSHSPERFGTFRISRQARISTAHVSNSLIGERGESKSSKSQDLPFAQANSQLSVSTVQRKAQTSVNSPSLGTKAGATNQPKTKSPVIKGIIQTKAAEATSQSTVSTRSIMPMIANSNSLPLSLQGQQANLPIQLSPVQLSPATSIASNPAVVSSSSSQLSDSSGLSRVWLKSTNGLQVSEGLSTIMPSSQKMPLPLAKIPINTHRAIAKPPPEAQISRQTKAVDNSTVQLAMQGNSTMPMSSPETAVASSPIDISQVAKQVSRMLARQIVVERERRGLGRWH
ncbi:MAG: hypothetical protein QNJ72_30930 [Pleurocapsa sp. MO_226.B13]|nr:hypothetical protein [Pleurocapsa sp. MO_226.B13]